MMIYILKFNILYVIYFIQGNILRTQSMNIHIFTKISKKEKNTHTYFFNFHYVCIYCFLKYHYTNYDILKIFILVK